MPHSRRTVPAIIRCFAALAVTGLFIYAYLSPSLRTNALMATLAKTQFSAALLGAGVSFLVIIVITALFGKVYCSVLCPLGTLQEIFTRLGKLIFGNLGKVIGGREAVFSNLKSCTKGGKDVHRTSLDRS